MTPAEQIQRLSVAIEAMEWCRMALRESHRGGGPVGEALVALIAAQAQVATVLEAMVEATKEAA